MNQDPSVAVAFAGAVAFGAVFAWLAVSAWASYQRRATLSLAVLCVAPLPLLGAVSWASAWVIKTFSQIAQTGAEGQATIAKALADAALVLRVGMGALALAGLAAAALALLGKRTGQIAGPARAALLMLLPLFGALLALGLHDQARRALRIASAAAAGPADRAAGDAVLESEGFQVGQSGVGAIGEITSRLAWMLLLGTMGGAVLGALLLAFGVGAGLLGRGVDLPGPLRLAGAALALLVAAFALALAAGVADPTRLA